MVMTHGKLAFANKVEKSIQDTAFLAFYSSDASKDAIKTAEIEMRKLLYGGREDEDASLRFQMYTKALAKGYLSVERLPPIEGATCQHSLRAWYQLLEWKVLGHHDTDPSSFGWLTVNGKFIPVPSEDEYAPASLLKVICCNCKFTSESQCGTNRSSGKKNHIRYMSACGSCMGNCGDGSATDDDPSIGEEDSCDEYDDI